MFEIGTVEWLKQAEKVHRVNESKKKVMMKANLYQLFDTLPILFFFLGDANSQCGKKHSFAWHVIGLPNRGFSRQSSG